MAKSISLTRQRNSLNFIKIWRFVFIEESSWNLTFVEKRFPSFQFFCTYCNKRKITYDKIFLLVSEFDENAIQDISAFFTEWNIHPSTNKPQNSSMDYFHSKQKHFSVLQSLTAFVECRGLKTLKQSSPQVVIPSNAASSAVASPIFHKHIKMSLSWKRIDSGVFYCLYHW